MSEWGVWVAIYAAFVATGALFLEMRRWFESRPRLAVDAKPSMATMNMQAGEDQVFVLVTVRNRGQSSTTITHLGLLEYPNWITRVRRKHSRAAIVMVTQIPPMENHLPFYLEPGAQWSGAVLQDQALQDWIDTKRLYVAIYASHFNQPICRRVEPEVQIAPPDDAERI